ECQTGTTRAFRRRQLPTNHGHAALPLATRVYQPDSSSKTPHPPRRAVVLRNSFAQRGSDPPKNSLDGRSFHISWRHVPMPAHAARQVKSNQTEAERGVLKRTNATTAAVFRIHVADEFGSPAIAAL